MPAVSNATAATFFPAAENDRMFFLQKQMAMTYINHKQESRDVGESDGLSYTNVFCQLCELLLKHWYTCGPL